MRINTKYQTNANGRGQILATGAGRQRTSNYDDAKSLRWNHGNAAGTLALVLVQGRTARRLAAETAKVVKTSEDGCKMTFSLGE